MSRRWLSLLWLGGLLGLLWVAWQLLHRPPVQAPYALGTQVQWSECWFDAPWWRPVHCGFLRSSNSPVAQDAEQRLPVVYVPAFFWRRKQVPVVYIAGGPGGATGLDRNTMPGWLDWLDQVAWPSDVILYDQRGVGLAQPQPRCRSIDPLRQRLLASELPEAEQYRQLYAATMACAERLQAEGWDLSRFNTLSNAEDVERLVAALRLEQWRVYAVSYGTRIGLELQRRHPQGLQALVLDSVYPPDLHGEAANPWLLDRALHLLVRTCELLDECHLGPQRVAAALQDALIRLRERPLRVNLRRPGDGVTMPVLLHEADLVWLIFESQYDWRNLHLLPGAVEALSKGHLSGDFKLMLQDSVDAMFDTSLNEAVGISVDCADNGPLSELDFEAQRRQFPAVARLMDLDWRFGSCRGWPSGDVGEAFRQPVLGVEPTLLLSGEFDPVTPPEWAEHAARTQRRGYALTFSGIGHGVLDSDACAVLVVQSFWADPDNPAVPDCLAVH